MLTVMIRDLVVTFVVLMLAQGVRCLATSHASLIASSAAMPRFSSTELSLMDRLQKQGSDPGPIFKAVNAARHRQRAPLASSSAVYRYLAGETYDRDAEEARGRTSNFGAEEMAVYDQVRKRLQKESGNEWAVTWEDVAEEGQMELRKRKLLKRSEDGLAAETLRKRARDELGVGRRPAPQHVTRTDEDEKRRLSQAKVWVKKASTFWGEDVAFIDNKKFVMARTPLQRKRMRAARIVNHLRKASERNDPIYIVPKRSHSFTGIPSVEITAAVARDRIVMWRQAESWNGEQAAANLCMRIWLPPSGVSGAIVASTVWSRTGTRKGTNPTLAKAPSRSTTSSLGSCRLALRSGCRWTTRSGPRSRGACSTLTSRAPRRRLSTWPACGRPRWVCPNRSSARWSCR